MLSFTKLWLLIHLSLSKEHLLYISVLQPIWTYALSILSYSCDSLRAVIQRFQNKILRRVASTLWYITNITLHQDFCMPWVNELILTSAACHECCLHYHENPLALQVLHNSGAVRRLCQCHCANLVWQSSHLSPVTGPLTFLRWTVFTVWSKFHLFN